MVLGRLLGGTVGAVQGGLQGGWKGALAGGALGSVGVPWATKRLAGAALANPQLARLITGKAVGALGPVGGAQGLVARAASSAGRNIAGIGALGSGGQKLAAELGKVATSSAVPALTAPALGGALAAGYGLVGMPGLGSAAAGLTGGVTNKVSGLAGYNAVQGLPPGASGPAVPAGLGQFGGTPMYGGSPYDVIDLGGALSANRLAQLKQAQLNAAMLDAISGTQLKWTEETKRRDLQRQLAAAGIRQNIATQAALLANAQQAGLNMGTTAASQVGQAMANAYNYG